jgi:hypothetical protein
LYLPNKHIIVGVLHYAELAYNVLLVARSLFLGDEPILVIRDGLAGQFICPKGKNIKLLIKFALLLVFFYLLTVCIIVAWSNPQEEGVQRVAVVSKRLPRHSFESRVCLRSRIYLAAKIGPGAKLNSS